MRILFVLTPSFNPNAGGVQRTTYKLGKQFTIDGHEVAYFSASHLDQVIPEYGRLYYAKEAGGTKNSNNIEELGKSVKSFTPDVVINQMPPEYELRTSLFILKKELNFLLIGCLRNSLFKMKLEMDQAVRSKFPNTIANFLINTRISALLFNVWKFKFKNRLKDILDKHDLYIVLTKANIDELRFYVGNYLNHKVKVIPNSIPELVSTDNKRNKVLLHVGRIEVEQKRSDLLLDVWKKIANESPDWKFVIVGDGEYMSTLRNRIEHEKIQNVEIRGRKNPSDEYMSSEIFMMPSAFEGFPNTILEAQSNGLASLAFNSYPAISEIVNNGKDAILIEPYDVQKMADGILNLMRNDEYRETLRNNAYQNVSKFLIENVKTDWYNIFEEYSEEV